MNRAANLKSAVEAILAFSRMLLGIDRPQLYRPEAHYMRGPGPKWRALHGSTSRAIVNRRRSGDRPMA